MHIFRVGTRPAAFDIMDAEFIEPLRYQELIGKGESDVF